MADSFSLILLPVLLVVGFYVWTALALQVVLRKAGEPGWQAWVPILNTIVLLRLGGFSGWWVLLGFLPVVNIALIVVLVISLHRITVAFDYGTGMTVLAVLLFPIWLSVLAWGTAEWLGHDDPPADPLAGRHRDDELETRLSGPLVALPYPFDALAPPTAPTPPVVAPTPAPAVPVPPVVAAPVFEARPAVPETASPVSAAPESWAPPASRRRTPTPIEEVSDTSAEVSAVAAAPRLGAPRAAASAVSALWQVPEDAGPLDEGIDETVVAARRRVLWQLTPPSGAPVAVTADVVVVGRRPSADPAYPTAQLVAVVDDTRTMSKTHARLERHGDVWTITDLGSTNGVFLVADDGSEVEVLPGAPQPVGERFLLGDAPLRFAAG